MTHLITANQKHQMVEVFKTNVSHPKNAKSLVEIIHRQFPAYRANFDLEDCDNILRVECAGKLPHAPYIIETLQRTGFHAEVLADEKENQEDTRG
ncbi:hypothetical protein SAMN04488057_11229 [Cyclobacterium lianum]|uniref:HMA domain-containing protein n=1 Tax=Cyclobacterium lianum TaxID=388280 RepID=A0A1M7PYS2_9BACT|nr:hypothetical protein [Cyclobacterium lianum]SHN22903.1 hypothetical protein SAMN04488057_11229 [Cyclobacterium lianum]